MLHSRTSFTAAQEETHVRLHSRRHYLALTGVLIVLLLVTGIPYAYGAWLSTETRVFMGIVSDVPDTVQYFSWMRAHQEALIVSNWMTPEANEPAFFNMLWFVLGHLAQAFGLSFSSTLQVLRIVAGLSFGYSLFWFYGLLANTTRERWLATLLVLVGGGIGWIWVIEKYLSHRDELLFPLDVQVAEPNALLCLIGYPHFLLAAALLLATFGAFYLGATQHRFYLFAIASVIALILGVQHAYDLITIYMVLAAFVLLRWWQHRIFPRFEALGLILVGCVSSPPAAYFAYLTSQNPIWRQVLSQFDNAGVFTPNVLHLVIVLGPQLLLAAWMLPSLIRRRSAADLFLFAWTVVGFALLYIPTDFQIHMLNPYQVPLALLAVRAIVRWAEQPQRRQVITHLAPLALISLALLVNVYLFSWRLIDLSRQQAPYYLGRDEVAAIAWLDHQPGHDVVLASETIGQYIPAYAAKRSVLAHWAQTVDYYTKRDDVARVFDPAVAADTRQALLKRYGVAYVIAGQAEVNAGSTAVLDAAGLKRVFVASSAIVYRVP